MNQARIFIPEVRELIDNGDRTLLNELMGSMHASDITDLFSLLAPPEKRQLRDMLTHELFCDIFEEMETQDQAEMLTDIDRDRAKTLLDDLSPDVRVDLFQTLDDDIGRELLEILDQEEKEDVRRLMRYDEDSAGGTMTTEYAHVLDSMTTGEAMTFIKNNAEEFESVYYIYVMDKDQVLKGVVSLKDFILADPKRPVTDVMVKEPFYVEEHEDREEAARLLSRYNLLALPVLDDHHRLVGMITHDDILDVMEEEATEDMIHFGGASSLENSYLQNSVLHIVRTRVWWLIGILFFGSISAVVIDHFETSIAAQAWLVFFIPMLVGTAGNAGTQSATVIIRSLATGEVEQRDIWQILRKELLAGMVLGLIVALFSIIRTYPQLTNLYHCLTTATALLVIIPLSTLVGSFFPLLAERLQIDPALMSSPLLATFMDMVGLLIYFEIARLMLGF